MYIYKKQGCGVAIKEIIQYLRIRETRCFQNALKWYKTKSFKKFCQGASLSEPPSFGGASVGGPQTPASSVFRP